ncbi:unnamed protein product [Boreogadus saida]
MIATNRRATVQYNPPSSCILEIDVKGIKLVVQDDYYACDQSHECNHFFQLKNVSFCGFHPKNSKYFGFITKHPADQRFACHVFVSENSTKPLAESVGILLHHHHHNPPIPNSITSITTTDFNLQHLNPLNLENSAPPPPQPPHPKLHHQHHYHRLQPPTPQPREFCSACMTATTSTTSSTTTTTTNNNLSPSVFYLCRKAFQLYYKQFVEVSCPTEDIYLE